MKAGFTLLETLAALVILGMVLVALNQGTQFGLHGWASEARLQGGGADLEVADRTLRRFIEHMDPGSDADRMELQAAPHVLAFTADLPAPSAEFGSMDVALGIDHARRLVLHWAPHPHVQSFGPPPAPETTVLAEGVARLDMSYFRAGPGGGWRPSWTDPRPPDLVAIHVGFGQGDTRHWPPIIAGPLRDRVEE